MIRILFKIYRHLLLIIAILFLGLIWNLFFIFQPVVHGSSSDNIRGWAWSENVGWLSLNCYNDYDNDGYFESHCIDADYDSDYGVNLGAGNKITGYAWSENIGWVCFGSTCSGTAPDGLSPLVCLGNRSGSSCLGDYGENFPSTTNLQAHWKLNNVAGDGTTADSSGKGNTGYLKPNYPSDAPMQVNGKYDKAFYFDGDNDYIEVSYSGDLNLSSVLTIEAWVKQKATGSTRLIVSRENQTRGYGFGIDSQGKLFLNISGLATITSTSDCSYPSNPDAGVKNGCLTDTAKWHHIAVSRDSSNNFRFYLDGFLNGNLINNSAQPQTGASQLNIGRRTDGTAYFQGYIDNVSLWKRAKSSQEIWDDAVAEISGWAKIESLDNNGWIRLKATQELENSWWGTWRDSAVSGYVLGGWGWNGPDQGGIGWLKFDYYNKSAPADFDDLRLNNTLDCLEMLVQWDVSQGAESYSYSRCDNVSSAQCSTCTYTVRPVPSGNCLGDECYVNDTGLTENTGYCYKIRAESEGGETYNSDGPEWGTTIYCTPKPEDLTIDGSECGLIKAQWSHGDSIAEGYTLYRTLLSNGCDSLTDASCQTAGYLGEALPWDSLVGHWRMNESSWTGATDEVFDSADQGNHGTAKNGATTAAADDKFKRAGSFDGQNDYFVVDDAGSLDIGDTITVEGWVKFNNSDLMTILAKGKTYKLEKLADNRFAFSVQIGQWESAGGATIASAGQWYHLVGTYLKNDKVKIYVNGKLDGEEPASGSISTNNIPLSVGAYSDNGLTYSNYFNGLIDNLAVSSRVKSAAEIKMDSETTSLSQCNITCTGGTCCRYSDSRIIPRVDYYYRVTSTYRNFQSVPSTGHQAGKTLCFPPIKMKEE